MRTPRVLVLLALPLFLTGCMGFPQAARTTVTPGESEIRSEREERRPSESSLRIRAVTPPAPEPAPAPQPEPPVRIRIIIPQGVSPQEGGKAGGE